MTMNLISSCLSAGGAVLKLPSVTDEIAELPGALASIFTSYFFCGNRSGKTNWQVASLSGVTVFQADSFHLLLTPVLQSTRTSPPAAGTAPATVFAFELLGKITLGFQFGRLSLFLLG